MVSLASVARLVRPGTATWASVQETHVPVEAIDGGVLRLRGGRSRAVLDVQGVPFLRLDAGDQEALLAAWAAFLNGLTFPVQLLVRTVTRDLEGHAAAVERRLLSLSGDSPSAGLAALGGDYVRYVRELTRRRVLLERRCAVVVPADGDADAGWDTAGSRGGLAGRPRHPLGRAVPVAGREVDGLPAPAPPAAVAAQLAFRCVEVTRGLERCGLSARRLGTAELTQLLAACWCPERARAQPLPSSLPSPDRRDVAAPVVHAAPGVAPGAFRNGTRLWPSGPTAPAAPAAGAADALPPLEQSFSSPAGRARWATPTPRRHAAPPTTPPASPAGAGPGVARPRRGFGWPGPRRAPLPPAVAVEAEVARGGRAVADQIAPTAVRVAPDHLQLEGQYVRTLAVTGYPRTVGPGWLAPLVELDAPLELSVHVAPLETAPAVRRLSHRLVQLESSRRLAARGGRLPDPERETATADVERLRDALQRGEERVFSVGLYLLLRAPSLGALDDLTRRVEGGGGGLLARCDVAWFEQDTGLHACLPQGDDRLRVPRTLDTTSLALSFPFCARRSRWTGASCLGLTGARRPPC